VKVKSLIEQLSKLDPELDVIVFNWNEELVIPDKVEVRKYYKGLNSEYIQEGNVPSALEKTSGKQEYANEYVNFDGVYIGW